jgi:hypothetical protein
LHEPKLSEELLRNSFALKIVIGALSKLSRCWWGTIPPWDEKIRKKISRC